MLEKVLQTLFAIWATIAGYLVLFGFFVVSVLLAVSFATGEVEPALAVLLFLLGPVVAGPVAFSTFVLDHPFCEQQYAECPVGLGLLPTILWYVTGLLLWIGWRIVRRRRAEFSE
jgi:uncharacterized membrane protein